MIHRFLYRAVLADSLFLLALSSAAYHHTDAQWLLYAIYISASMAFLSLVRDVASWPVYIGDAISFHARCIRDKNFDVGVKADVNHFGRIEGK